MGGTIVDAYGPRKAMAVRDDTWGHLAPEPDRTYEGFILFAASPYPYLGGTVIEDDFPGMDGNPWYYDGLCDFLDDLADGREPGVYLWRGTYRFVQGRRDRYRDEGRHEFRGRTRRVHAPGLPGTAMSRRRSAAGNRKEK